MTQGSSIAAIRHGMGGGIVLHGGWFGLVDPHYYSGRAGRQRVSFDFFTQALMKVLLSRLPQSVCGA